MREQRARGSALGGMVLAEDGSAIKGSDSSDIAHALLDPMVVQVPVSSQRLNAALAALVSHGVGIGMRIGDERGVAVCGIDQQLSRLKIGGGIGQLECQALVVGNRLSKCHPLLGVLGGGIVGIAGRPHHHCGGDESALVEDRLSLLCISNRLDRGVVEVDLHATTGMQAADALVQHGVWGCFNEVQSVLSNQNQPVESRTGHPSQVAGGMAIGNHHLVLVGDGPHP